MRGMPLRRRLVVSSLLGAIPLFLLGVTLLFVWYYSRRDTILQSNQEQARLAAVYVSGWLEGQIRTLRTLSASSEVRAGTEPAVQGLIDRQIVTQPEWENIFVTDASGREITSYLRSHTDISDREYFQQAKATLKPAISNILIGRVTGHRIIIIAVPIIRDGEFHGIVGAVVRPSQLQSAFTQLQTRQGDTISLWGDDQRLIARTGATEEMLGQRYPASDERTVLSGKSGARVSWSPIDHVRVLIGYAPVSVASWTIVTATPASIALVPVYNGMLLFLLLSSLVIALTLAWAFYSSNIIAAQVAVLANCARAIGEGNFATRVSIKTGGELGDLANSLNKMATDLQATDRLKSDLLSMVSHEFKTPLTSIRTALELITTGAITQDHPRFRELLDIADRQSRRLQDMIENLLIVARFQAGGLVVTPRPRQLASIVSTSVRQYQSLAEAKGLTITAEVPQDIRAMADTAKITLALNNMLDNAIKFTDKGHITVAAHVEGEMAVVTVTDTGVGLTPEARGRLFELFYQAEPLLTRKAGGAGLGLYVTKAIIESHGGHVFAESAGPGAGSTFGFTLPLASLEPT